MTICEILVQANPVQVKRQGVIARPDSCRHRRTGNPDWRSRVDWEYPETCDGPYCVDWSAALPRSATCSSSPLLITSRLLGTDGTGSGGWLAMRLSSRGNMLDACDPPLGFRVWLGRVCPCGSGRPSNASWRDLLTAHFSSSLAWAESCTRRGLPSRQDIRCRVGRANDCGTSHGKQQKMRQLAECSGIHSSHL